MVGTRGETRRETLAGEPGGDVAAEGAGGKGDLGGVEEATEAKND